LFQCKEAYIPFYDRKNLKFVITYSSSHAYKILQIKFRDDKFSSCVEDLSLYFNISVYRLKSKEDTAVSYYDGDNGDFKLPIDVSSESSFFNISDISEIGIGSKPNRLFHSGSLYIADDGYRVLDSNSSLAIPFFPSDEYLEKCMLYKVLSNDNTYYFCGFKSSTYNNKTTPFKFNTNNPSITGLSHLNSDNGLYSAKDLGFSSYNYNLLYTGEKDSLYSPTTYIRIKAEYDTYSYADNLERYILTVEELDSSNNTLGKRIYHVYGNRQI
jgi:hypothetical protein